MAATLETRGGAPSTTSLWLLIFMILLFNGSFVCAPLFPLPPVLLPALTSFQFCYRCVYIFQLLSSAAAAPTPPPSLALPCLPAASPAWLKCVLLCLVSSHTHSPLSSPGLISVPTFFEHSRRCVASYGFGPTCLPIVLAKLRPSATLLNSIVCFCLLFPSHLVSPPLSIVVAFVFVWLH